MHYFKSLFMLSEDFFPMIPPVRLLIGPLVGLLVCRLACHNFPKGRDEVTLPLLVTENLLLTHLRLSAYKRRLLTVCNVRSDELLTSNSLKIVPRLNLTLKSFTFCINAQLRARKCNLQTL